MKTTLDLPDDVMRAVKIRAVEENRRLKDVIADLPRRGLEQKPGPPSEVRRRVKLPLVECAHEVRPDEEMTPERAADALLEEEARWHHDPGDGSHRARRTGSHHQRAEGDAEGEGSL